MLVCLLAFSSCGGGNNDDTDNTHQHTFDYTKWVIDETHHWYGASCEHKDVKLSFSEHADDDNNGVCDTCEYDYNHEHTYESTWSSEGLTEATHKHFHKASCGHTIENIDVGTYSDENHDGKCDVCDWSNSGHSHTYEASWTIEGTEEANHKHYKKITCEHIAVGNKNEGTFVDENKDGVCDDCSWYDESHTHTHSSEFTAEGATEAEHKHYYAVSCSHTGIGVKNEGTFVDSNKDGKCDVCQWNDDTHEHTFDENWTIVGETESTHAHYYKLTCGHTGIGNKEEGSFVDENKDGVCDTCKWYNENHQHTYASKFTTEGTEEADHKHYYAVSCSHTGIAPKDEGTFVDEDKNGVCDDCGWFDATHEHTYEEEWTFEGTTEGDHKHYYKITCSHTGVGNKDEGVFADVDKDGVCICGWYDEAHTHTYEEVYSQNTTHHGYKPSCSHTGIDWKDYEEHKDTNSNLSCDVCGYDYGHEHTFDTNVWVSDSKGHYHPSTCIHTDIRGEEAGEEAHTDENKDGKCDVCQWFDETHTHTFATKWSFGGTTEGDHTHYYAVTCEHTGIDVKDLGSFTDEDKDGVCICGWYDATHEHTYEDVWTTEGDAEGTHKHYKKPSCTHTGIDNILIGEFNDSGKDGICDDCGWFDATHEHTYEEEWTFEGTTEGDHKHYYKITCPHTGIGNKNFGVFIDANDDGNCDDCGWFDAAHVHTFEESWTYVGTNPTDHKHYYKSTCGHTGVFYLEGEFIDEDNDGVCDDCEASTCSHTYDETKYVYDIHGHWYKATCGHSVKGSYVDHTGTDEDKICDICTAYVDFEAIVNNATSEETANKVLSGTISKVQNGTEAVVTTNVEYKFGVNFTYIKETVIVDAYNGYYSENVTEYWYTLYNNGQSILAMIKENDGELTKYNGEISLQNLKGYYFPGSFIDSAYNAYGVEALVYGFYNIAVSSGENSSMLGGDVECNIDSETGANIMSVIYNGYKVEMQFTVNDGGIIETATVKTSSELNTMHYEIMQVQGERTENSPHDPEADLIKEIIVKDADGNIINIEEPIIIDANKAYNYFITLSPDDYDKAKDGVSVGEYDLNQIVAYLDGSKLVINGFKKGEIPITLNTNLKTVTLRFQVVLPAPTEFLPEVNYNDGGYETITEVDTYIGIPIGIGITVNQGADPDFIAEIISGGDIATLTWDDTYEYYTLNATATGTVQVKLTSVKDEAITTVLTVTAKELPTFNAADILNGKYQHSHYDSLMYEAIFYPASEGATEGMLWYNDLCNVKELAGVYTYKYIDGVVEVYNADGTVTPNITINISEIGELMLTTPRISNSKPITAEIEADDILIGKYDFSDSNGVVYSVIFTPEVIYGSLKGKIEIKAVGANADKSLVGSFRYEYKDGGLYYTNMHNTVPTTTPIPLTIDSSLNLVWSGYTANRVNLTAEDVLTGKYEVVKMNGPNVSERGRYYITFDYENKTFVLTDYNESGWDGTYSFTYEGGVITIDGEPDFSLVLTPGHFFSKVVSASSSTFTPIYDFPVQVVGDGTYEYPFETYLNATHGLNLSGANAPVYYTFTPYSDGIFKVTFRNENMYFILREGDGEFVIYSGAMEHTIILKKDVFYTIGFASSVAEEKVQDVTLSFVEKILGQDPELPFELTEGTLKPDYPGGEDVFLWFVYEAKEDCTVEIKNNRLNVNVKYGTDLENLTEATGKRNTTYTVELKAGEKLYFAIQQSSFETATLQFTTTITPKEA